MKKILDNAVTVAIVGIIFLIIIPLGTGLLDVMLIVNITFSLIILLIAMNIKEALEFSVFPSILLITTLLRVALNVSSTRLILGNGLGCLLGVNGFVFGHAGQEHDRVHGQIG